MLNSFPVILITLYKLRESGNKSKLLISNSRAITAPALAFVMFDCDRLDMSGVVVAYGAEWKYPLMSLGQRLNVCKSKQG